MKCICSDITHGLYSLFLQHIKALVVKHEKSDRKDHTPCVRLVRSSEGRPDSRQQPLKDITSPRRPTVECEIGIIIASPRGRKPKTTTTSTRSTATAAAVMTTTTNKDMVVSI